MHPISTRTPVTRRSGLAAGIEDLAPLEPPALVLEAAGGAGPLAAAEATLRRIRCPVLACVGPIVGAPPRRGIPPSLASAAAEDRHEAAAGLVATLGFMSRVRCARLIVEAGSGDVEGPPRTPASGLPASGVVADWSRDRRRQREAATERLCRGLDAVARSVPAARVLLLPGADPFSLLDLEATGWVLDDLRSLGVRLAFDTGHLGLREAQGGPAFADWLDRFAASVDVVLFSDHDGSARCDLLPGMGRFDFAVLRGVLPQGAVRVLRPSQDLPADACRDADAFLADRIGRA